MVSIKSLATEAEEDAGNVLALADRFAADGQIDAAEWRLLRVQLVTLCARLGQLRATFLAGVHWLTHGYFPREYQRDRSAATMTRHGRETA